MSRSKFIFECPQPGCKKRYTRLEYVKRHARFQHHCSYQSEQINRRFANDPEEYNETFTDTSYIEPAKPLKLTWPGTEVIEPSLASTAPMAPMAQDSVQLMQNHVLRAGQARSGVSRATHSRVMCNRAIRSRASRGFQSRVQAQSVQTLTHSDPQEYTPVAVHNDPSSSAYAAVTAHSDLPALAYTPQSVHGNAQTLAHTEPTLSGDGNGQTLENTEHSFSGESSVALAHSAQTLAQPKQPLARADSAQTARTKSLGAQAQSRNLYSTQSSRSCSIQPAFQVTQAPPAHNQSHQSAPSRSAQVAQTLPALSQPVCYSTENAAKPGAGLVQEVFVQQRQEIERLNDEIGHLHVVLEGISQLLADEIRTR